MKTLALIFSLVVIILSVSPCCAIDDHLQNKSLKTFKQQSTQTEDCCMECSPFYTCGACGGFTVIPMISFSIPSPLLLNTPLNSVYLQVFEDGADQNIWQPPKLSS